MEYQFLPETTEETRSSIMHTVGSLRLSGLEPSPEAVRDLELVALGKLTHDEAVERAIQRVIGNGKS